MPDGSNDIFYTDPAKPELPGLLPQPRTMAGKINFIGPVHNYVIFHLFICGLKTCYRMKFLPRLHCMILSVLFLAAMHPLFAQPDTEDSLNPSGMTGNQHPDSIFLSLKKQYAHFTEDGNRKAAAQALQKMGQVCFHMGHYSQSLDFYLQASALFRESNNREQLAETLNDIGRLYYYNKQIPEARRQFDAALAIFESNSSNTGLAITFGHIGHLYEKQQQYDSAFYFQRKALAIYQTAANKEGMAAIYENMGSIFEDLEKYDSAQHYYSAALTLYKQYNKAPNIIEVYNNLGDILRKTGHYEASLQYTREALQQSLQSDEAYQLSSAYRDMAKAWHLLNRDDSAFHYQELSRKSLLDIYSSENNKQFAFLQVLNDISKKDAEIEKLKIVRRNTTILTVSAIVVVLLLIVMGSLIISRQRLKIRNERLLRDQNEQIHKAQSELMIKDLQNKQLHEDVLQKSLEMKTQELSAYTLHVIQKNQVLKELHGTLEKMVKDDKRDQKKQMQQLVQQIDINFNQDQNWDEFRNIFEQVHESFYEKVRKLCGELTANDLRLVALIKMNINSGDMSTLLGISPDSLRVTRYRLRKKFKLNKGENLATFIQNIS